jgi:DNA modification methylase
MVGDWLEQLRTLPSGSCHVVCTSPPYYSLRDYAVVGQLGLETTPAEYIEKLVLGFREVRRVMRDDATLWLNIADSYAGSGKGKTGANGIGDQEHRQGFHDKYHIARDNQTRARWPSYAKPKDLLLIPFRLAIALQDDGWWVRSDIAWCKKSCMPESVTDRPTSAWEHVFLLSKKHRYYYDAAAVADIAVSEIGTRAGYSGYSARAEAMGLVPSGNEKPGMVALNGATRNMRNFWLLGPSAFSEAHFATFPPEIPRRAILAGCPPGGTVLDPFGGAGTTGLVADRLGRDCILIELSPVYAAMAQARLVGDNPMFTVVEGVTAGAVAEPIKDKQGALGKRTYSGFNARWDAREAQA